MFVQNKYYAWYLGLINKATTRNWSKKSAPCYVERHHIIPKSIQPALVRTPSNLVYLTAREHFIAHLLLVKCTLGSAKIKMQFALSCMLGRHNDTMPRYIPNSKLYEFAKHQRIVAMASSPGANTGKTFSDSTRLKMSLAKRGRTFTPEHKANMLAAQRAARYPKPACCIKCRREFKYNPTKHFNLCHHA